MPAPNKPTAIERLKDWLYENGFEGGIGDKALQKPLAGGIACVVASFVWIQNSTGSAASFQAQLNQEKDRGKVVADYAEAAAIRDEMLDQAAVPPNTDAKEWIQGKVTSLASESGLEVVSSEFMDEKAVSPEIGFLQWNFVFRGKYHALGSFLFNAENHKPAIGITSLEFVRSRDFEPSQGLALEIKAVLFVLQSKAAGGARR